MRAQGDSGGLRFAAPPGWRRLLPVTRLVLVLGVLGYLACFLRLPGVGLLTMDPLAVRAGQVWRLVTYPVCILGIWNLLFGLLIVWSCGTELELYWGSRRYGVFLVSAALGGGLLGFALSWLVPAGRASSGYGAGGLVTAVIVAWALLGLRLPTSLFGVLPLSRGAFAALALIIAFFGTFEGSRSLSLLGCVLGGVPVAWLFSRRRGGGVGLPSVRLPRLMRRRRFRVVRGEEDGSGFRFH